MPTSWDALVSALLGFFFGGGVFQLYRAKTDKRKAQVETDVLEERTDVELHEISMNTLIKVNENLKRDYDRVVAESAAKTDELTDCRGALEEMSAEMVELQDDLRAAQRSINDLQSRLTALLSQISDTTGEPE